MVWISLCSGQLFGDANGDHVAAIEGAAQALGVSPNFVALVLLPNIGNAAESLAAVAIAYRGRMDMALGTALGSALQVGECVGLCVCGGRRSLEGRREGRRVYCCEIEGW